jgi:multidrug efflux system membrane fusion protein
MTLTQAIGITCNPRLAAASIVMLSLAAATGAGAQSAAPPVVTVAKPIVREIVEDDEFVGRFEAVDEVTVRSRVGGYLDAVHFHDGALINKGDLLFTIDQRPFRAALDQAKAQLAVAKAQASYTETQFHRAEQLSSAGNMSISTLDDRRREYLSAVAQVDGAQAAVTNAELNLEFTEIRAPIAGRIDRRWVSVGNLVQADQTQLTAIVSLDPIQFYFDVDEREFLAYARDARTRHASLQEGAGGIGVVIRLADDVESPVNGKLDFGENRVDRATGTMRLRASVANPDLILQPGLFGRVNVPGSLPHPGVLVPDDAIGADQDRRIVYVVDEGGMVSAKPVRLGPRLYGYRVIRDGLSGNETIVINGLMRIRPGAKVMPKAVTLPPEQKTAGNIP